MEDNLTLLGSVLLALTVVSITIVLGTLKKLNSKTNPKLNGVDVLQLLGDSKPFPLETNQSWTLCSYSNEHRVWTKELSTDQLIVPLSLYGSYCKIKGNSQLVLNTLKDISRYQEWEPELKNVRAITIAEESKDGQPEGKTPKGLPVQHDIIKADTDFIANRAAKLLNLISFWIQGESILRKSCVIHRYWHREENGCCWLLELDEDLQEWCFYLAQPLQGLFEIDQCMVSVVTCPHSERTQLPCHIPASKLGSLQNYLVYKKLQTVPLNCITLPTSSDRDTMIGSSDTGSRSPQKSKNILGDIAKIIQTPADEKSDGSTLLSRFKNLIEEKREWYEREKKKRQSNISGPKTEMASNILQHSPAKSKPPQLGEKTKSQSVSEQSGQDEEVEDSASSGIGNKGRALFKLLRSNTVTGTSGAIEKDSSSIGDGSTGSEPNILGVKRRLNLELTRQSKSVDLEGSEAMTGTASLLDSPCDTDLVEQLHNLSSVIGDEKLETSYKTAMNQAAADIMAEKVRVANIDITKPYEDQAEQTGGWIYCGLEKDIVILRKIYEDGSPIQSYLGKGMIPVPPKTVFEALKNPRTRYTYDEMLKKMDVLHDFGNGMKVIYLYHEVSQLFKKEARDFCILQSERIEGTKFVISMRSVGWPGFSETNDTVRGKFSSSGWIIEPCVNDGKVYSMVTYIVQMELGSSRSNHGYLVEELAAKQPLSIAYLRQYLVPTSAISRSLSAGQVQQKRRPQLNTLATVAAAASGGTKSPGTAPEGSMPAECNSPLTEEEMLSDNSSLETSALLPDSPVC